MLNYLVNFGSGAVELAQEWLGRPVSGAALAAACGALDGAEAEFTVSRWGLSARMRHPYLLAQERSLRLDAAGRRYIFNHEFTKRPGAPNGLARQTLLRQIPAAQDLGVNYLETWAAGDPRSASRNGYYTWAVLGFARP